MDDPLEQIRQLAAKARMETPPRGHVAARVISRLRDQPASLAGPLTVFAALTGVFALVAVLLLAGSISAQSADPLGAFFQVASVTMI